MSQGKLALLLVVGAALLACPCTPAAAEDLTVVGFGGLTQSFTHEAYWQPFEKMTGIHLIEDTRDFGIGIVRTKVQGGANTWDVVAAEDIEVIQGCEEGLFQKLDWSKIQGSSSFLPGGKLPCAEAQIIYGMNLVYDGNRIKSDGPKNWADFWDVKKWPGKRAMYKDPRDSLEIALMADGVAKSDVYKLLATPAGLDRAFRKLDELKSNVLWWTSPGLARQSIISGDAALAEVYGNSAMNINRKEHTNFVASFQDQILHIDYYAIVKGTPHLAAAEKLMDYYSQTEPEAKFLQLTGAGVPNRDALPIVQKADPTLAAVLSTTPEHLAMSLPSDPQFWLENYDAINQRFTAWLAQ
jgi:putative spermidine/putrescine transport system substrate-binding protein